MAVTKTSAIKIGEKKLKTQVSGALRHDSSGKGTPSLISPIAYRILAQHCQGGVEAGYPPRNWEDGLPLCSILDSIIRHCQDELEGKIEENHPAAIFWNAMVYVHTKEMIRRGILPAVLNDLPNYIPAVCPKHRKYKPTRAPRNGCDICQMIWDNKVKK